MKQPDLVDCCDQCVAVDPRHLPSLDSPIFSQDGDANGSKSEDKQLKYLLFEVRVGGRVESLVNTLILKSSGTKVFFFFFDL